MPAPWPPVDELLWLLVVEVVDTETTLQIPASVALEKTYEAPTV